MASAPNEPAFDKAKFPEATWLDRLWQLVLPFFRDTAKALNQGLTHSENMASFVTSLDVVGGQVPVDFANKLPGKARARGVVLWGVTIKGLDESAVAVITSGIPVAIEWHNVTLSGTPSIRLRAITGLTSGTNYVLTLVVYAG